MEKMQQIVKENGLENTKIIAKMNEKFFSINKYFQILGKYFLEHIIVRVIIH